MGLGQSLATLMGAHRMLVKGPHSVAGVAVCRVPGATPFFVFYPAAAPTPRPANWFLDGFSTFFEGYVIHKYPGLLQRPLLLRLLRPLLWACSLPLPARHLKVPSLYIDAPPADTGPALPLIVFSHGLTGTAAEHTLLLTSWALQGYVVVAIRHCDRSSTLVRLPEGDVWYDRPDFKAYDLNFRPRQLRVREAELHALKDFVLRDGAAVPPAVRRMIDPSRVLVAGFSYGAATAALSAVLHPKEYQACLLLDGWFHLDLESVGLPGQSFDLPREVHEREDGLPLPTGIWMSQSFSDMPGLGNATRRIARVSPQASLTVLPGTTHFNFIDLPCWLPPALIKRVGMLGKCDPHATYHRLVAETVRFLAERTAPAE
eukprot:EG_transcript_11766